jgi:hypothetical protein
MTSTLPVGFYLRELSGEPARRGGRGLSALGEGGASEIEARVSEAHAHGVLEGRAAAQAANDAALASQTAALEQRLATEREMWAGEQGSLLGELIAASFADIEQRVSQKIGQILRPLLEEKLRAKAVMDLAQSLDSLLAKGDYAKVAISGPKDLLAALEARLGGAHAGLSFIETDRVDVTVEADETVLETRIKAWMEVIGGSGGDGAAEGDGS